MMYTKYLNEHKETLDLYTRALTRAHNKTHPEVFEVRDLYVKITNNENSELYFKELSHVTKNYRVPNDVCETFKKTYEILEKLDHLYFLQHTDIQS